MITINRCFPKGKMKALTMSYDDGRECDKKLIDIFNKYSIKGTFHLNSGVIDNKESREFDKYGKRIELSKIKKVYEGHEVACHTVNHIPLTECPKTQVVMEVSKDRETLEKCTSYPVRGISYPYGCFNEKIKEVLKSTGIEYARTAEFTHEFSLPKDFLEWDGTCRNIDENLMKYGEEFLNMDLKRGLALMYVWGHSYEFVRDNSWDKIEEFCRLMSNKDDIWYATNIEIVDYLKAFDNLKFSIDRSIVHNPSSISVWIVAGEKLYEIKGGMTVNLK